LAIVRGATAVMRATMCPSNGLVLSDRYVCATEQQVGVARRERCELIQFAQEHFDCEAGELLARAHMFTEAEGRREPATAVEIERVLERVRVAVGRHQITAGAA
jgi:hypothetical protein